MARFFSIENGQEYLWQFDENRVLIITHDDARNITQVEFDTDDTGGDTTYTAEVLTDVETGHRFVQIPNELLGEGHARLVCYAISTDSHGQYTRTKEIFRIKQRQIPEDYTLTYADRISVFDIKAMAELYRDQAGEYMNQSYGHAIRSMLYANEAEDVEIEEGKYSSKNWSEKSRKYSEQAGTYKDNAKKSADLAKEYAENIDIHVETVSKPDLNAFIENKKTELDRLYPTDIESYKDRLISLESCRLMVKGNRLVLHIEE